MESFLNSPALRSAVSSIVSFPLNKPLQKEPGGLATVSPEVLDVGHRPNSPASCQSHDTKTQASPLHDSISAVDKSNMTQTAILQTSTKVFTRPQSSDPNDGVGFTYSKPKPLQMDMSRRTYQNNNLSTGAAVPAKVANGSEVVRAHTPEKLPRIKPEAIHVENEHSPRIETHQTHTEQCKAPVPEPQPTLTEAPAPVVNACQEVKPPLVDATETLIAREVESSLALSDFDQSLRHNAIVEQ